MNRTNTANSTYPRQSELGQIKSEWSKQLATLTQLVDEKILPQAFASEIAGIQTAIQSFKLAVPLVGQFSVGKSRLLNTWLGQDVQTVDLRPCTSVATEFHFALASQEKLVVHWHLQLPSSPVQREEFALDRYPEFLAGQLNEGREALFAELHLNRPVLDQHPDLILVDTPGLGSTENQHDKALKHYLGEGVACILCITRITQVGKEELAFVQRQRALGQSFSLLVCQEDISNTSEIEATRIEAKKQAGLDEDQLVRGCSASEGNLVGFEDILSHIEQQKAALFHSRMAPKVQSLIEHAERLIQQQLTADNTTNQLNDKKAAIAKSIAALNASYAQEEHELLRDCDGSITRQVLSSVSSFLRGRREAYATQIIDGRAVGATLAADAQNSFQLALEQHFFPRLLEAAQTLGKNVPSETIRPMEINTSNLGGKAINANAMGGAATGTAAGAAAGAIAGAELGTIVPGIGNAIGAAIGGVLGGVLGFLNSRNKQKDETDSQVNQAIESVITQIQSSAGEILKTQVSSFLVAIRQQIEKQLETETQNICIIEQQLSTNAEQKQVNEQKASTALATIRKLLSQQAQTDQVK